MLGQLVVVINSGNDFSAQSKDRRRGLPFRVGRANYPRGPVRGSTQAGGRKVKSRDGNVLRLYRPDSGLAR